MLANAVQRMHAVAVGPATNPSVHVFSNHMVLAYKPALAVMEEQPAVCADMHVLSESTRWLDLMLCLQLWSHK